MAYQQTTKILKDLNLEDLIPQFLQESITLDTKNKLSIDRFRKLRLVNVSYSPQNVSRNGAPKFGISK